MMKYQPVGEFEVFSWSIAGNETCVGVRADNLKVAFDIGFAPLPLLESDHVFISHGHADHIGAITQHMKKRQLNRFPKAVYYMPECLVEHVRTVCRAFAAMSELPEENEYDCSLVAMIPEKRIQISDQWSVEAVKTDHSVASLGYVIYRTYPGGDPFPDIAYLGDSQFSVILDASTKCPDLLSVRLLIMEATFLDRPNVLLDRAHKNGHTHLDELRRHASLFKSVENLYLVHFSARYDAGYIHHLVRTGLPAWLAKRVVPSVCAQRCLALDV